ncbi:MAG: DUF2341 domain-containing protein [Candidatus Aureabacteria bacterium]|nr:DUF2341 domain-containing protein [Candidatus Auribacterota bacterium]
MQKLMTVVLGLVFAFSLGRTAVAGSINSPGAPSGGSGMYSISQVYDYIVSGAALEAKTGFQEPTSAPVSTMKTMKEIGDALRTSFEQCEIYPEDVTPGKKYFSTIQGWWGVRTGGTPMPTATPTITATPTVTPTPIWLSGWDYKRPISISSGSALQNYQVLVTLNTQELIPAKMRSDGGDVRFTDSDGLTLINYWIESGINTPSTRIWVRATSVPAGSSTIYMYYGNSSAASASNGDITFDFFDDFTSANTTKWAEHQGSLSVSGGMATIHDSWVIGDVAFGYGYMYELMSGSGEWNDACGNHPVRARSGNDMEITGDSIFAGTNCNSRTFNVSNDGSMSGGCGTDGSRFGSNSLVGIARISSSSVKFYLNNGFLKEIATNVPNDPLYFSIRGWGGGTITVDWVRIRKYSSPEPTASVGTEGTRG